MSIKVNNTDKILTTFLFLLLCILFNSVCADVDAGADVDADVHADVHAKQALEEIIVTASLIDTAADDISNPLHIIDQEAISTNATQSLGEMIDDSLGISSSDYGAAVGQPIIRGLGGIRVKVLNNGMVIRDISGLGADHGNDIDLNHLEQIEIIKGPSSLLYANGTIGGIVNIVDNTIPKANLDESQVYLSGEYQDANDGMSTQLTYAGSISGLNLTLAYSDSEFDFYEIPSRAVIPEEGHAQEEQHATLNNSDYENTVKKFGVSKVYDRGYMGFSLANKQSIYGIPAHGEEAGHDEDSEHEEEHEAEHEAEHAEERIFSTTDSDSFTLEGIYNTKNNQLDSINYHLQLTDYILTEQHAETDHGSESTATRFSNNSKEFGLIFDLGSDAALEEKPEQKAKQKLVVNYNNERIKIVGEEAYLPEVESNETTFGYFISKDLSAIHIDFGIRHDRIERDTLQKSFKDNVTSASFTISRVVSEQLNIDFGLSSVARLPSAVELFVNGPHLATQRFEEGQVNLQYERANNIDISFDLAHGAFFSTLTFYRNEIDNYIYLLDEEEANEPESGHDEIEKNEADDGHAHASLRHAFYTQQDAEFTGYEFEIGREFIVALGRINVSLGRDRVLSKFSNGGYVPRSVPSRNLLKVVYESMNDFTFLLTLKDVERQQQIADHETHTSGFQMLDIRLTKVFQSVQSNELSLSVFGKNLLNEVARNHTSFVKEQVPLSGRNIGLKFNYSF